MPAVARIAAGSDYRGAVEAGTARGSAEASARLLHGVDCREPAPAGRRVGGVRAGRRLLVAADHAAVLAVAFAQNGFLTRDAGHRQVFRSRRANHVVGLVHGNLAVGSAFGWWVDKHSSPPCAPQSGGLGPDIGGENLV